MDHYANSIKTRLRVLSERKGLMNPNLMKNEEFGRFLALRRGHGFTHEPSSPTDKCCSVASPVSTSSDVEGDATFIP